jgi:hypothetical protein
MNRTSHTAYRLPLIILATALAATALAQPPQVQKPYEPSVGQPGKDVVWVPTSHELVDKMLDIAKVTPADYLIDLGSGDGRTVITAAKRGLHALGIEYNPDMVELSKANAAKEGVSELATFVKADIFESDFSKATVITMFLLPNLNLQLRPKILDLKPGTRIVANTFTMGDWTADETTNAGEEGSSDEEGYGSFHTALLWIVPAKVAGTWQMGEEELVFTQTFQTFEGTFRSPGRSVPISNGRLRGDQISFTVSPPNGDLNFSGTVSDGQIHGTVKKGAESLSFTATLRKTEK